MNVICMHAAKNCVFMRKHHSESSNAKKINVSKTLKNCILGLDPPPPPSQTLIIGRGP